MSCLLWDVLFVRILYTLTLSVRSMHIKWITRQMWVCIQKKNVYKYHLSAYPLLFIRGKNTLGLITIKPISTTFYQPINPSSPSLAHRIHSLATFVPLCQLPMMTSLFPNLKQGTRWKMEERGASHFGNGHLQNNRR